MLNHSRRLHLLIEKEAGIGKLVGKALSGAGKAALKRPLTTATLGFGAYSTGSAAQRGLGARHVDGKSPFKAQPVFQPGGQG